MHVSENGNTPFYGKNLDPNELMGKVIIMLSYESTSFLLTLLWVLNAAGYKKWPGRFFFFRHRASCWEEAKQATFQASTNDG